jgi:ZIP family zinc transporter
MMIDWLTSQGPVGQALIATVGTYLLTALGTVPVLFFRSAPRRLMDVLMGFAGGVMIAASCWSLLVPAMAIGGVGPAVLGLLVGAGVLFALDKALPHLHPEFPLEAHPEGPTVAWRRPLLLFLAITLHNIPEGLAVGVAYGSGDAIAATALAIGIGLQNIPEGLAIALPLRREGMNRWKAFFYGQLSAAVEPFAGVAGAALMLLVSALLPYAMAFAAGAMIYVVIEELIPETARSGTIDIATLGFIAGFAVMMALDNGLR